MAEAACYRPCPSKKSAVWLPVLAMKLSAKCDLYDGQGVVNEVDPQFWQNFHNHIDKVLESDLCHFSAITTPR